VCVHASAVFSPFVDFSDFVNNCITGTRKLVIIVGIKKIQSLDDDEEDEEEPWLAPPICLPEPSLEPRMKGGSRGRGGGGFSSSADQSAETHVSEEYICLQQRALMAIGSETSVAARTEYQRLTAQWKMRSGTHAEAESVRQGPRGQLMQPRSNVNTFLQMLHSRMRFMALEHYDRCHAVQLFPSLFEGAEVRSTRT
jgi:hypothetical protein